MLVFKIIFFFFFRLALRIDVEPGLGRALVPSLILQPLVENAVRHGNLSHIGMGRIDVRARRIGVDGALRLRIEIEDDGPGPQPGAEKGSGIGIPSTIERLRLLYGEAQRLEMRTLSERGFQIAFELPLHGDVTHGETAAMPGREPEYASADRR